MPHNFSVKLIPNEGYALFRNRRSLRVGLVSAGARLPDELLGGHATNIFGLAAAVEEVTIEPPADTVVLKATDFADCDSGDFYKYVPARTWQFMQRGSFQLGSPDYYRRTDNPGIGDWREGFSVIAFRHENDQATFALRAGYNAAIFCGTREVSGPDHARMMEQFSDDGGKCLRISVAEFMAHVKKRVRAFRVRYHDAIYTDAKCFAVENPIASEIREFLKGGLVVNELNRRWFQSLYDTAVLPSLFAKPRRHSHERERRIAFELRDNLQGPTLLVNDRALLDFVEVVDTVK